MQFRHVLLSSAEEVNDLSYGPLTLVDHLRIGDKYLFQCHLFGTSQLITAEGVSLNCIFSYISDERVSQAVLRISESEFSFELKIKRTEEKISKSTSSVRLSDSLRLLIIRGIGTLVVDLNMTNSFKFLQMLRRKSSRLSRFKGKYRMPDQEFSINPK